MAVSPVPHLPLPVEPADDARSTLAHFQEIQDWLRAHLFDQVPIAISIIDRDYNIVDANPKFEHGLRGLDRAGPATRSIKTGRNPA